ncbi:ABC transporter ATP-binding protein [Maribacter algarum]|uniref:ABC transporter ATP-binding protein n=1 Tax=Maribacter algarum (ex Zhang et al. 2020) TaxID=2578118 RepID=A0A5S3Q9G3_9FLAO|nr:ABC transporter ATP-binding protein [Maribacter algarum]TMM53683.1 ABC transporter ATP-binding protein [Maribacter algarum]
MSSDTQHITISTKDLTIGYKNVTVANTINFDSLSGEFIGIVGINGIGKSTLLRTLAKIQPSLSGSISIEGKALNTLDTSALASEISIVLTEPIASKNLTVQEVIALGRQPYTNWIGTLTEQDTSKIKEAIQMLQLEDLVHKKCYELSDGQLQRVMIARALAQDTSIILLDEPTTHLDLYHKVQILKLLKSITEETKKTILFTSHEIEMVIQLCDKLLLLKESDSSYGTPNELIEKRAFDTLFPSDTVIFDANTGTFRIQK